MTDIAKVREFVVHTFLFDDGSQLKDDMSFLETGTIDSTGVLELVSFLERTFGITVADDELLPENLDSVDAISGFLARKTASSAPQPETTEG